MTSNLVSRLRSPMNVFYEYAADDGALMREAAERIETLERALRNIAAVDVQSMALDALRPGARIAPKEKTNED